MKIEEIKAAIAQAKWASIATEMAELNHSI